MPSPIKGRKDAKYYKRKGGGYGKGKKGRGYSRHSIARDRKGRAKKGTRKQVTHYPQAYD